MAWTPWGNVDLIPGFNVGNAVKQGASFVGLAPQADYDIFDGMTISNRPGQMNVMPGSDFGKTVPDSREAKGVTAPPQDQTQQDTGGVIGSDGRWYASAAAATASKADQTRRNIQTTQQGYTDAANQSATDVRNKYQGDVQKFLATIQNGQDDINSGMANNALNLRRSMSNIAGGIRQGIKSGGVQLANMNATDSGAADAMARAYATMGNQQAGDANNEAALKEAELTTNQVKLNRDRDEGVAGFDREREAEVSRIRGDLRNKLALLDAQGAAEGVNGAVDMGIVDRVINQAVAQLAAVDQMRNQRLGGVRALDKAGANAKAAEMDAAGMEGTSPFGAGTEGIAFGVGGESPMGAATSQLPQYARDENGNLIAIPKKDKNQPVV